MVIQQASFLKITILTPRFILSTILAWVTQELPPYIRFLKLQESARHIFKTRPGRGFLLSVQKQNDMENMPAEWE